MTAREKVLSVLAAVSVITFAVIAPIHNAYLERISAIETFEQEKKSIRVSSITKNKMALQLEQALARNKELKERLAEVKNNVIPKEKLNSILGLLENSAMTSKIDLLNLSVESGGNKPAGAYEKNIVRVSLISAYAPLAYFISRLFETELPITISRLTITPDGNNSFLLTSIEFEVYTL
ncbi:hypothetical protein MNBD_NITROSPINAE01-1330 [hydrothermal vent metagenome]|uniref:Type IV pilus biogenesis protein PilO n=1 Tax=hydrothermal vent metagenome TaxID=652676 RepID=A0A3B1BQ27_9ZZZZ